MAPLGKRNRIDSYGYKKEYATGGPVMQWRKEGSKEEVWGRKTNTLRAG